jgi:hypothetical protein
LAGIAVFLAVFAAEAQELEPRAYANLPIGLNFVIGAYGYSQGGLSTDPSLPIEDAHLKIHTAAFGYARSVNLWGCSGKLDVIAPYSHLYGSALVSGQPKERDITGLNDPRVRLSINFYGAPALAMPEFAKTKQDFVVGASVQVTVPVGQYDPSKAINLGSNRWAIKPDFGFSKSFRPVTLDLTVGATFYQDNDDFFGGQKLEQDPLYSMQLNLSYDFGRGIWAALGGTYYRGGRTTLDGVRKDDALSNSRGGLTVAVPASRKWSVKFNVSTGINARTGTSFDTIGVAGQFRWGAGL